MSTVTTTTAADDVTATVDVALATGTKPARRSSTVSTRTQIVRGILLMVFVVSAASLLQLTLVGRVQHLAAQQRLYDQFRAELAAGTAPRGATDSQGSALVNGAPVAYLEIPAIGVKQVVVEGTRSSDLFRGAGHRRDTVLPGQFGTSVIFGRRALYGGSFSSIAALKKGDTITATTGQGVFTYRVLGVRHEGDQLPLALAAGGSRLTLATAGGSPFLPHGVVRVDADLDGTAVAGGARLVTARTLPGEEQPLAGDSTTLWALVLWLQALLVVVIATIWSWHRWGRAQTWVVASPLLILVGLCVWSEFARLLPNIS